MNVAVLVAGIADPKWPLDGKQPRILSPFDESAIEVALKLRDAVPDTKIALLVGGSAADDPLARSAAAHRADFLRRVEIPAAIEWDVGAQAKAWMSAIEKIPMAPDLVLLGREFGDRDDGALPAALAESMAWPYAALVQELRAVDAGVETMRERGAMEERTVRAARLVASVTNDRRNKLRHPLMKNVMAAKRAPIEVVVAEAPAGVAVCLRSLQPAAPTVRGSTCRMLDVAALAQFLRPWGAQS